MSSPDHDATPSDEIPAVSKRQQDAALEQSRRSTQSMDETLINNDQNYVSEEEIAAMADTLATELSNEASSKGINRTLATISDRDAALAETLQTQLKNKATGDLAETLKTLIQDAKPELAETLKTVLQSPTNLPDTLATIIQMNNELEATTPSYSADENPFESGGQTVIDPNRSHTGSSRTSRKHHRTTRRFRNSRISTNANLPQETQALDTSLQLSRNSVFVEMFELGRNGAIPGVVQKRVDSDETDGRYLVNRPLASGGMGAVLDIADRDFQRQAAMKVIHAKFAHQPEALERFLEEAQITAQLEHPNIVPIHDIGVMEDGTLYYTMKMIQGESLGDVIKHLLRKDEDHVTLWTTDYILLTFLKILDGLSYAHNRGVVHRDIKPDNIMIETHGEVLVVDWGIAKVLGDSAVSHIVNEEEQGDQSLEEFVATMRNEESLSATQTGAAMGTPYYMPPEQAHGRRHEIDARSDVYALGVTLYEMLSLKRPFQGKTIQELLTVITDNKYVPLDEIRDDLHPDLVALVHRCFLKNPEDRYQSCEEFAQDIRNYLSGKAVLARKRNLIERIGSWIQKHKTQVIAACLAFLLLAGGIIGTVVTLKMNREAEARELLNTAQKRLSSDEQLSIDELQDIRTSLSVAEDKFPLLPNLHTTFTDVELAINQEKQREERERNKIQALEFLKRAQNALAASQLEDALSSIETALNLDGSNSDIQQAFAEIQQAETARQRIILLRKAKLHKSEADNLLKKAVELDMPLLEAGDILEREGKIGDIEAIAQQVIGPEGLLQKSIDLYRKAQETGLVVTGIETQIETAAALHARVLSRAENNRALAGAYRDAQSLLQRAQLEQKNGKLEDAQKSVSQALTLFPYDNKASLLSRSIIVALTEQRRLAKLKEVNELKETADAIFAQAIQSKIGTEECRQLIEQSKLAYQTARKYEEDGIMPSALGDKLQELATLELRNNQALQAAQLREDALQTANELIIRADKARVNMLAAQSVLNNATATVEKLQREQSTTTREQLYNAVRLQDEQGELFLSNREEARSAAFSTLETLSSYPDEEFTQRAQILLADIAFDDYQNAVAKRDEAAKMQAYDTLNRFDKNRKYLDQISDRVRLEIKGLREESQLFAIRKGTNTRLQADQLISTLDKGNNQVEVESGSYLLKNKNHELSLYLRPGQNYVLQLPKSIIPSLAINKQQVIKCSYVPGVQGAIGVMMSNSEITTEMYTLFLQDQIKSLRKQLPEDGNGGLKLIPDHWVNGEEKYLSWRWDENGDSQSPIGIENIHNASAEEAKLPITQITKEDAEAFCSWLSKKTRKRVRLPNHAEWIQAFTAEDPARIYPWGDFFDPYFTVSYINETSEAAPVTSKKSDRGPYGHYDLAGNVCEFLSDGPENPLNVNGTLIAGGSFFDSRDLDYNKDSVRSVLPDAAFGTIGFRIVVELPK